MKTDSFLTLKPPLGPYTMSLVNEKLTIQIAKDHLPPRVLKINESWFKRAAFLAWGIALVALFSSVFAVRVYLANQNSRPEYVEALENEVKELKIALEKKPGVTTPNLPAVESSQPKTMDPLSSEARPALGGGIAIDGKEGVWGGLADGVTAPPPGNTPTIKLEDSRISWDGKYVNFIANVAYRDPGQGSQQGHLVVLARSQKSIYSHPEGALNTASGSSLFNPERGEYFSVSRFRILKSRFGPFENQADLSEIQVFAFDLKNKLILVNTFKNGK